MGYRNSLKQWKRNGCKYRKGDVVKFGYVDCRLLTDKYIFSGNMEKYKSMMSEEELTLFDLCDRLYIPWDYEYYKINVNDIMYDKNGKPLLSRGSNKRNAVLYLRERFCGRFGYAFSEFNECTEDGLIISTKHDPDAIINSYRKSYISKSDDGFIIVTNPTQFCHDLLQFKTDMKDEFRHKRYSYEILDRLDWFIKPPKHILDKYSVELANSKSVLDEFVNNRFKLNPNNIIDVSMDFKFIDRHKDFYSFCDVFRFKINYRNEYKKDNVWINITTGFYDSDDIEDYYECKNMIIYAINEGASYFDVIVSDDFGNSVYVPNSLISDEFIYVLNKKLVEEYEPYCDNCVTEIVRRRES